MTSRSLSSINPSRRGVPRSVAICGALAALASTSIAIATSAFPASAALGLTDFEIDGNTAVDGGQDWASDPADAPNLQGFPGATLDGCSKGPDSIGDDQDRIVPGTKIDDLGFDAPPTNDGLPNTKSDLCSVYESWELVFVPDGSGLPGAGQYEFVFYGAWSRPDVQGEIDVLFPLLGSVPGSNDDDLVISYDFADNTQATTVTILEWDGDSWEPSAQQLPAGSFEAETTQGVETAGAFDLTFGEFAINLTAAGILPENGPCVSFTAGDPITRTGNSASATLEDIVDTAPAVLTNCGSLTIDKITQPAVPSGSPSFTVETSQLDGAPIQSGGVTLLTDSLVVPDSPSVTHVDLLISPDYQVVETALPPGWTEQSLVCTSFDPIVGEEVTRVLWADGDDGPDTSFPIAPGMEASCEILNVGPPTVTVQKITVGGAGGPFSFDVVDGVTTHQLTATTTAADTPTTVDQGTIEVAAGEVTVAETGVPAGFFAGDLTCSVDGDPIAGATAELLAGQEMLCVQENLAAASVSVTKTVDGTSSDWAFDFTISPVPDGETATKTATAAAPTVAWDGLEPGVSYEITEGTLDGYLNGAFSCEGGQGGTNGPVVTPAPGQAVSCTAANTELGSVAVTKTVDGTATDWAFDFTISPVPDGETATRTATAAAPTVAWDGLVPGRAYTITETGVAGYITGTLDCGGGQDATGTSTFTAEPGTRTACSITNTELGSVTVTKTVDGTATDWAFDFTISPVPDGETATRTATAAAPTVAWDGLVPGRAYTITEAPEPGFVTGTITCPGGQNGVGSSTITPTSGSTTACTVSNVELATVSVTKTVEPAETGWSFDVTIAPVPAGETATKSATAAAPTVSWTGLVPGTEYTVTESSDTDLVVGVMTCTGGDDATGTSSFTPSSGQDVTCAITNTRIADVEVVKTTSTTSALPGAAIAWTIQVTNNGPSTALEVQLLDALPASLALTSVQAPAAWDCSASVTGTPGSVSCTKPDMLPGETWTFTVNTTLSSTAVGGDTVTNVAVVSTTTDETTTANNTDSDAIEVEIVESEPPVVLPPTGGYVASRLLIAAALLGAGTVLLLAQRRRRPTS